jgi:hypothetical protein
VVVGRACAIATVLTSKLDSTGAASHAKLPTVYKYTRVVTTALSAFGNLARTVQLRGGAQKRRSRH